MRSKSESIAYVMGILTGVVLGIIIVFVFGSIPIPTPQQHDPKKMLELREACLKGDPSLFTTYCDHFAEEYSRIK